MIEWGLTYAEFDDIPAEVIGRIKEHRMARSEGESRKHQMEKMEADMKAMKNQHT